MKILNFKLSTLILLSIFAIQTSFAQFGKANKVELPETYTFDYSYKLKVTHKKGDVILNYFLKQDANYFGFDLSEMNEDTQGANIFMVLDSELEVTAMFMQMMGKNVVQKTKLKPSDYVSEDDMSDYDFKQIDSKIINGYDCEGYVSENEKHKITFYITDDVPVSFNDMFGKNVKNLPKGFNSDWMKKYAENGLMMEMIFEDKKKSKNNMTMLCTDLEPTDFSIDTTTYTSMMGVLGN